MRNVCMLIFVFFLSTNNSVAGVDPTATNDELKWWLNVGFIGNTFGVDSNGAGAVSGVTVESRHGLFTLRNSYYEDANIFESIGKCLGAALFSGECNDDTEFEEWAILYGKALKDSDVSLSAGIGRVKAKNADKPSENFSTIGLPFEAHWRPTNGRYFGVGFIAAGNINKEESFVGLYLTFQLGKLK